MGGKWREQGQAETQVGPSLPTASVMQVTCRTSGHTAPASGPGFRDAERGEWVKVGGASGRLLPHANRPREQDRMCEPPQCLVRHSKCGNSCSFTSTQIPLVVKANLPSFRKAVLGNKVPTSLSWHSPKPPHKAKRMLICSQHRPQCLTDCGPTLQEQTWEPRRPFEGSSPPK